MFLSAVGKGQAKFRVSTEFLGQPERHFIRIADRVVVQVLQNLFAIPNNILERQWWRPAPDGVPVLIFADVLVAGVILQQQVVNEFGDVEMCLQLFVLGVVREIMHRVKGRKPIHLSVLCLHFVYYVVIFGFSTEVIRREIGIRAFGKIINSPVEAIEEKMNKTSVSGGPAHGTLGILEPGIANSLGTRAGSGVPVHPGIIVISPKD